MRNFLIALLIFCIWTFFGLWLYTYLRTDANSQAKITLRETPLVDELSPKEQEVDLIEEIPVVPPQADDKDIRSPETLTAITPTGELIFRYDKGIPIRKNDPSVSIPGELVDFKYRLNTYLLKHTDEELNIISRYGADEQIQSPNLGVSRGNILRDHLVAAGLPPERIKVESKIGTLPFSTSGIMDNGFRFEFGPLTSTQPPEEEVRAFAEPRHFTIRPDIANGTVLADNSLKELATTIRDLLEDHPDLRIKVIGHTDNVGNSRDNYSLALNYARQVRLYLIRKSRVDRKNIIALSEGESNPVDTNKTKIGRRANSRFEIEISLDGSS